LLGVAHQADHVDDEGMQSIARVTNPAFLAPLANVRFTSVFAAPPEAPVVVVICVPRDASSAERKLATETALRTWYVPRARHVIVSVATERGWPGETISDTSFDEREVAYALSP